MVQFAYKILHLFVSFFIKKEPIQTSLFTPLSKLGKFLSHKEKLLAGMTIHKAIRSTQICKFIIDFTRHFIDHRAFSMHYLIM